MEKNWAAEHLQTIRTLMERSALYRRALAPISTFVGVVGIVAAVAGWMLKIEFDGVFALYWMAVGVIALGGALTLVRRQAVKQGESFWSPPTRRVAQAMAPALLVGLLAGLLAMNYFWAERETFISWLIVLIWTVLYGVALHSAGFFIQRGIRLFGWGFIIAGMLLMIWMFDTRLENYPISLHWLMGILFGASHLAYGIYLYFTERKNET